mgnify:FL=1
MSSSRSNLNDPITIAAKLPARQRIAALGEALLVAPPQERQDIALMLIEMASFQDAHNRTSPSTSAAGPIELFTRLPSRWRARHAGEAMLAIARCWSVLPDPMKSLAAGLGRDRWLQAARTIAGDTDHRARLSACTLAHDTADPGLGTVVATLLGDEHQSVRKAADKAMMRMTMVMLDHLPDALLGDDLARIAATPRVRLPADQGVMALERCILLGAIADGAWSFATHRCRSPLLSALLVMDRAVATPMEREISDRMRRLLSERNHPSHAPLRTVLRRTPCPILRLRSFRWLTITPIASAALDRLAIAESIEEHEIVLNKAHLAIRPRRAAQLVSLKQPTHKATQPNHSSGGFGSLSAPKPGVLPDRKATAQLSEYARRGLIAMSSLVTIDPQTKRDLLEPGLADPSPLLRLATCEACPPMDLPDFMYDAEPAIARRAGLNWSSVGHVAPKPTSPAGQHRLQTARVNARSPHAWVRRIANEEADRLTIINPASPASRAQARRLYKLDPVAFVRTIRDYLANPNTRGDALMLIRIMGIEHRFELDLISILQTTQALQDSARDRATAVMALGAIDSNTARYVLSEALSDRDDRIRSNAVESVEFSAGQLLELKGDAHHRVRASAIRRLISGRVTETSASPSSITMETKQTHAGGQALLEMLHDDRPMHRLAATWAAQRTLTGHARELMGSAWKPLVSEVESLASDPRDPQIQIRAQRCIQRIVHDLDHQRQSRMQIMHNEHQEQAHDDQFRANGSAI